MNNKYNQNIENTRANGVANANLGTNPYINQDTNFQNNQNLGLNTLGNNDFLKGALIGAAVTYLLTNKKAQETIFGAVGKGTELFQAGMEELKERYADVQAAKAETQDF